MYYYKSKKESGEIRLFEPEYSLKFKNKTESVFSCQNGYMGVRASLDFRSLKDKPGLFISGFYSKAVPSEVTELVNCPDFVPYDIEIEGELLSLDSVTLKNYERSFSVETGELRFSSVCTLKNGVELEVKSKRFASLYNTHLFCQEVEITPVNKDIKNLSVKGGINGQVTNSGAAHIRETECRVYEKRVMHFLGKTDEGRLDILVDFTAENLSSKEESFSLDRRSIYKNCSGSLSKNTPLILSKRVLVYDNKNVEPFDSDKYTEEIKNLSGLSYDRLFLKHIKKTEEFWDNASIKIEGISLPDLAALKYAQFQLFAITPRDGGHSSIAAKGLSGEGYKGHVFWDTEIFMLPFYFVTNPDIARDLLIYRYKRLHGARKKALEYGYKGAMYPWESAGDGSEETPLFAMLNIHTGKANEVWSGRKEHHVGADIAFAVLMYESITGDKDFMEKYGLAMLIEISKFWVSRAERKNGRLEILDTIGPDEYNEHIDNNAYTNYMAKYVVENTATRLEALKKDNPSLYDALDKELDITNSLSDFNTFVKDIYLPLPNAEGIIPQDDVILSKPEVPNIDEFKKSQVKQAILLKYSRDEVVNMKALKQADLVMLLNLFPKLFDYDIVKKNVLYYEKRTLHDSSLSYCAHAEACASIGALDLSLSFFKEALEVDLNDNPYDSTDGLHSASLGGIWNCVIKGYGGLSITEDGIKIAPHLPKEWKSMEFFFFERGEKKKAKITGNEVIITTV